MSAQPADIAAAGGAVAARRRLSLWQRLTGLDESIPADWYRPRPGVRALRTDALLAIGIAVGMVLSSASNTVFGYDEILEITLNPWLAVLAPVLFGLALLLRRIRPLTGVVVAVGIFVAGQSLGYNEYLLSQVALFLSLYSAAAWSRHRVVVASAALVIMVGFVLWSAGASIVGAWVRAEAPNGGEVLLAAALSTLVNIAYVLAATIFGANDYRRAAQRHQLQRRTAELAERTAALEAERRLVAEQAVKLDRLAIARELHDVVAHHVSLMGLQAAVARRHLDASPERSRQALLAVEQAARSAIEELQLLLGTLRGADEADGAMDGAAPSTRSLDQVPELVAQVRQAGLRVELHEFGDPVEVSGLVGLTAYRILQEALTNVRKHAGGGAAADVRIRHLPGTLELDVTDDGQVPPGPRRPASGRGITGMRERARAVGGTLDAGPRQHGGFRVLARLPVAGAAAEARVVAQARAVVEVGP